MTPPAGPVQHGSPTGLPLGWFSHPATSRIDNYLTGGCDHFAADRHLASLLTATAPWLPAMVKINQRHRPHAVTVLAREMGFSQFLDLGCGLPSPWNRTLQRNDPATTYEAARAVRTDARVVYVDNDPVVCAHARATLDVDAATAVAEEDVRRIDTLLGHPELKLLDRDRPVAVLVHDLLPWLSTHTASRVMTALHHWLPAGSAVSLSHATFDLAPEAMRALFTGYADAGIAYHPRSREQIHELLNLWDASPQSLVPTGQWRAAGARRLPSGEHSNAYAAVLTKATPPPSLSAA